MKTWPPEFLRDAKNLGAGKVIALEHDAAYPSDCPNCGGMGAMYARYVDGGPYNFVPATDRSASIFTHNNQWWTGELKAAACPACADDSHLTWLARNCGLTGADLDIRLDSFNPMPGKVEAHTAAAMLLSATPNPHGWVTFWGDYGRGKTHLLKALVNGFRVAGVVATFAKLSDLIAEIRVELGEQQAAELLLSQYKTIKVLAIDEIDRANWTSWAKEIVFRLLDARYTQRFQALTILASNLSPAELPEELGYLGSRMTEGVVVKVAGVDVRAVKGDRDYGRFND